MFKSLWLGFCDHYFEKFWQGYQDDFVADDSTTTNAAPIARQWILGQELECKWTDGEYYYGRISKVYKNGKFKFNYDDGDHARSVFATDMRERTPIVNFGRPDIPGVF